MPTTYAPAAAPHVGALSGVPTRVAPVSDDAVPGRTAFALAHAALGAALAPAETLRSVHGSRLRDRTTLVGVTATRLIVTHVERRGGDDSAAHLCWTRALPLAGEER